MGLFEKVEGTITLGILAVVGYVFIKNYDTLKELWCKIPGVCDGSSLTNDQRCKEIDPGTYWDESVQKCLPILPVDIIDEHGCNVTHGQYWCETDKHCLDAHDICPRPVLPCPPGYHRYLPYPDYPCVPDEVKPCPVDNGRGGDYASCPDPNQKVCYASQCDYVPGSNTDDQTCTCSWGNPVHDHRFSGCGEQCDAGPGVIGPGPGPDQPEASCGPETPVGSGCYPYSYGMNIQGLNCNVNCNTRCSDESGNPKACVICPPGQMENPVSHECEVLPTGTNDCCLTSCGGWWHKNLEPYNSDCPCISPIMQCYESDLG